MGMLRLWLLRLLPFLDRWIEAAPAACCGACPTCLTATAGGLTLSIIASRQGEEAEPADNLGPPQ